MTEDVAANEPFAVKEIDLSANTILTANFLASYTNGGPLSGDFAEAWFTVPVFGDKVNVTIGAKATLDGNVSLFFGQPTDASLGGGGGALATTPRSGAFATGPLRSQPDPTYLFLTANWTTSAGSEPQLVVTSGGTQIQEPDFAIHDIDIVSALSTAFSETVVIQNPGATAWSLGLVDSSGLGTVSFTSATPDPAPTIASFSVRMWEAAELVSPDCFRSLPSMRRR
jgi:hypothetical protein